MNPQNIVINERKELYRYYMPYIKGGGLFIPFNEEITPHKVNIGDNIIIILSLLNRKEKYPVNGKIILIQRAGMKKGYGVAFNDIANTKHLVELIENNIKDFADKREPTYTW